MRASPSTPVGIMLPWCLRSFRVNSMCDVSLSDNSTTGRWSNFSLYPSLNFVHTEKSFRNLMKSTWNQILLTIFRLIWIKTDVRLVPNQSENGKYNLISSWFNKISRRFLCVCILRWILDDHSQTVGFLLIFKLNW